MKFTETDLPGVFLIDIEPKGDERGFFSRIFCIDEFIARGLETRFLQFNTSFSKMKHTLRGMHYQLGDAAEVKVIKCIRGALWDVVLDLRPDSSAFGKWTAAELSAENRRMMYVPHGCAHGFMSLTEDVEMMYFVSAFYDPTQERAVRWNDPVFGIDFPFAPALISEKDAFIRDFDRTWHLGE
ncbi:MAG: dTDP-4-dehydrorhamnose 3,5-epimerase [Cypionkella sp.]|uniref:dTDP-4-dehydrorhamnose 3,5-epimerase n=1 Tax=Cypionkella sp. TaxID=2811411 RepID=UPI002AB8D703|nr:dTDP-4-dehydrorhamnose 3,5-epimerase [Cypionkella sp.]MDZ4309653.1 dTDP-4-dehydrorhamnose 3,5-epimerase [Cypionkella sp.]